MPDVNVSYGETQAAARQLQVPRNVAVILGCLLIGIIVSVIIPASASASISSISVTGPQESKNNRSISCPESVPRPAGYQCDEYPFASSFEGGAATSPPNRISAWVPAVENSLQGAKAPGFLPSEPSHSRLSWRCILCIRRVASMPR
jgi:hypothetical protein